MTGSSTDYRGWKRPGPIPPGALEPEEGETLDFICGHYRIFQYERGHRYSTDDVLTAWYGMQWAPRLGRMADLGSGIGSVAIIAAWRCPGASFCTLEAQAISVRLARKSIAYNGLASRFRIFEGDLRDPSILRSEDPFDLVFGTPPYFPSGTASTAAHAQAVPARMETRGDIADYARAASSILATGGIFTFVFPYLQLGRAEAAVAGAGLTLLRRRDVVFREGDPPMISLFAAWRAGDVPSTMQRGVPGVPVIEPPLVIRQSNDSIHPEYAAVRLSFGFPPGNVP
ncbi:MAG: methyltransferase [Acidobacteriota bacterium]